MVSVTQCGWADHSGWWTEVAGKQVNRAEGGCAAAGNMICGSQQVGCAAAGQYGLWSLQLAGSSALTRYRTSHTNISCPCSPSGTTRGIGGSLWLQRRKGKVNGLLSREREGREIREWNPQPNN